VYQRVDHPEVGRLYAATTYEFGNCRSVRRHTPLLCGLAW